MGAPVGNQNRTKSKGWQDALKRALARKGGSVSKGLDLVADQTLDAAINGDQWAILEIGNRIDGKPAQSTILTGDEDGGPVKTQTKIVFLPANME